MRSFFFFRGRLRPPQVLQNRILLLMICDAPEGQNLRDNVHLPTPYFVLYPFIKTRLHKSFKEIHPKIRILTLDRLLQCPIWVSNVNRQRESSGYFYGSIDASTSISHLLGTAAPASSAFAKQPARSGAPQPMPGLHAGASNVPAEDNRERHRTAKGNASLPMAGRCTCERRLIRSTGRMTQPLRAAPAWPEGFHHETSVHC